MCENSRQRDNFRYWEAWAQILQGWATAASGDLNLGIEQLTAGLDSYIKTGSKQIVPYAKTLLADAYLRTGWILGGLSLIEEIESEEKNSLLRFHRPIADPAAGDLRAAFKPDETGDGI